MSGFSMASFKAAVVGKGTQGFNYKYTELAQINKLLAEQKWSYQQYIEPMIVDSKVIDYMFTILFDAEGNKSEPIRGCRIVGGGVGKNAAQDQGAAITYARRYSLLMALGLACEDDDAQSLNQNNPKMKITETKNYKKFSSSNSIDFDKLRGDVGRSKTENELNELWLRDFGKRKLSEKQLQLVTSIFKKRKEELKEEVPDPSDEELNSFLEEGA